LNGYSAWNMNCDITTCTRKTTNWYFKTLDFKRRDFWKVRENSTVKKSTGKKSKDLKCCFLVRVS
jgi:hypothetical protein